MENNCNLSTNQPSGNNTISVSGAPESMSAIDISNNKSRYYAELAEDYKNEAKAYRDSAKTYTEQNNDAMKAYVDGIDAALKNLINTKQAAGDYALASDIPTVPTALSSFTDDLGSSPTHTHSQYLTSHQDISGKANTADLATVATSGSYNDLSNKPTIPAAQIQSDWNQTTTTAKDYIKNKPTIPVVPTALSSFTDDLGSSPTHTHSQYLTSHQTLPTATTSVLGLVKPDGTTITINDGIISSTGGGGGGGGGGASRNIGEIVSSTVPLTDAGLHLLDGALLSGSGAYEDFVDYISDIVSDYPSLFTTEADWQSAVLANGICDKFVYNSTNNTVRLPKYGSQICTVIPSELTVIGNNCSIYMRNQSNSDMGFYSHYISSSDRGMYLYGADYTAENQPVYFSTDKTKSSLVADSSTLSTSSHTYYYIVVANSTQTSIVVDINEIATDLNGKADVDLANITPTLSFAGTLNAAGIKTVVESYSAGLSRYRVWSDGLVEEWGRLERVSVGVRPVTFVKGFTSTNYNIFALLEASATYNSSSSYYAVYPTQKTTTGMNLVCPTNTTNVPYINWYVCGY